MAEVENETKHAGGRPPIYETPEQMQQVIDEYFAECNPHVVEYQHFEKMKNGQYKLKTTKKISHQVPYTISGLAYALGMSRQALLDYEKKDEFLVTVKRAKARVERFVEEGMLSSSGVVAGHIFNLKNNFGWRDRQELTGADGTPLMPVALDSAVLARMQKRGNTPPGTETDSEQ